MSEYFPTHEEHAPEQGAFRPLPSFRVHLLAGMSARHMEMRFQELFGLRLAETRLIGVLGSLGPLSHKQLCHEVDIEKSQASRLISRLVQRGLVERLEDENDQRAIQVRLTEEGQRTYHAIHAESLERNERWLSVLGQQEQAQFLATVNKLIAHTKAMLESDFESGPAAAAPGAAAPPLTLALDPALASALHAALGAALGRPDAPPAAVPG